jgi:amino acid adenylation domain-containing protein
MPPVEPPGRRPLTAMQTSMVLASMRDPHSGVYIVQDVCETPEAIDFARLQRAWRIVAGRHPALRTTIETRAETLMGQRAGETADIPWNEVDWTGVVAADRKDKLAGFLREDRARGFDFAQGVPMRITLLRWPGDTSTLIWCSHHVLLDGQSYLIVWREWFAFYDALAHGAEPRLPDAIPFTAYLDWLDRQDFAGAERYWRQHLAGVARTSGFIVDRIRAAGSPDAGSVARESVVFSQDATASIRGFARRHDLTVGTLVQCAWALLLSRYGGTADVVFGVTRTGRRPGTPGAANMVGPLINTLPFRIAADPGARVLPWLRHVREQMLAMRECEHTPLTRIRDWSVLPAGAPPFDTLFVYEYERLGETLRKLGGSWRERQVTRLQRTDALLTLAAAGSLHLGLDVVYDSRLFCRETASGMAGHLQTLIESFISQPDCRLAEVNMLTARERRWLIEERNQTEATDAADLCAHQLFERAAKRRPDAVAIDGSAGSISFAQLNRRSNQLAGLLRERGAGPEDLVGVCLRRSPDAVAAVLAVLKAGAAFVLLPPNVSAPRLTAMLLDAQPRFVIASEEHAGKLDCCEGVVLSIDRLEDVIARQAWSNLDCLTRPENAAYAAFTSGSTGRPKAAIVTHRALANHTREVARIYGITCADRRLQFAAIGSDMFISEVFTYLCSGATLAFCLDPGGNSIAEFLRLIEAHRITIIGLPSSWWSGWAAAMENGDLAIPHSLRAVIVGMERLNPAALAAFRRAAGDRLKLFNAYGPTEASPTTTIYEAGSSPWESASLVPIGRPIANTRVYVLDDYGNPVPMGVPGELYIGGDGVARGYLNAPDPTAAKFLPDPYSADPAKRMFRTGDRVFSLPDGNLVFLGRADRQVKIRGFRVEPEEIEGVLAEHPGVRHCAVVVHDDDGRQSLAAYLTADISPAPTPEELRLHLSRRLPDYMVPAYFTTLPDMPLTSNGKIDWRSLPPSRPRAHPCGDFVEPATPTEKRLARLWQEVLGLARVSATANFFRSGGDSLGATQVLVRIQREFGKEFPFALFLRAPTIAQIALVLDGGTLAIPDRKMAREATLSSSARQGTRLPLFCITSNAQDLYVFRHLTNHLDSAQPLFVLNVPFEEGECVRTVEELAARVCQSIRGIRAHGPYILGGYCFGGIVAFEAAQQLIADGAEVPLVALLDTPAPGYPRLLGSRRMAAHVKALGRFAKRASAPPVTGTTSMVQTVASKYVPKPIDAALAQFMAEDSLVSSRVLEDPRLAWRKLCRGHFQVYRVPGDHVTWLQEGNAQKAAARLTEALDSQNRGATASRRPASYHAVARQP